MTRASYVKSARAMAHTLTNWPGFTPPLWPSFAPPLTGMRLALGDRTMRPWLTGFSLCSAILLPLLMIGQTAPSEWLTAYCDELAPPVLSVVATGTVASLLGVWVSKRGRGHGR